MGRLPLLKGTPEVSPSRKTKVHNIPRLKLNSMQSLPRVPKLAMEMTKQQYFDASNFVDNFENDSKDIKDKAAFEINGQAPEVETARYYDHKFKGHQEG